MNRLNNPYGLVVAMLLALLTGCGENAGSGSPAGGPSEASLASLSAQDIAHPDRLSLFLPRTVTQWPRHTMRRKAANQKPGLKYYSSEILAIYSPDRADVSQQLHLRICDTGTMKSLRVNYLRNYDRDTPDSFRRSIEVGGHPGLEQIDRKPNHYVVSCLVGGRILVEASGFGIELKTLHSALDTIDLAGIETALTSGSLSVPASDESRARITVAALKAALPPKILGHSPGNLDVRNIRGRMYDQSIASSMYGDLHVTVRCFATAEEASEEYPITEDPEALLTIGKKATMETQPWNEVETVSVFDPYSGRSISRHGCCVVDISGRGDRTKFQRALQDIDPRSIAATQ